jgi:hypothetical protein
MMWQMEVVQRDRWDHGPLELAFFSDTPDDGMDRLALQGAVHDWNQSAAAGFLRSGDALDQLKRIVPALPERQNPNLIFVPTRGDGLTALHVMLASLLPEASLRRAGICRRHTTNSLLLTGSYDLPNGYGTAATAAFSEYIWTRIAPRARFHPSFFSSKSPLRLLAGDSRFWMHRVFRVALDRREDFGEGPTETHWKPLSELTAAVRQNLTHD